MDYLRSIIKSNTGDAVSDEKLLFLSKKWKEILQMKCPSKSADLIRAITALFEIEDMDNKILVTVNMLQSPTDINVSVANELVTLTVSSANQLSNAWKIPYNTLSKIEMDIFFNAYREILDLVLPYHGSALMKAVAELSNNINGMMVRFVLYNIVNRFFPVKGVLV